jgi:hypothetical protein
MRVLCKFLPSSFDHLQSFIASITFTPVNNEQKVIQLKNEHYKTSNVRHFDSLNPRLWKAEVFFCRCQCGKN